MGKTAKIGLKIKEKAEILAPENFQKGGNQLKRGNLTPLDYMKLENLSDLWISFSQWHQNANIDAWKRYDKTKGTRGNIHNMSSYWLFK